MIENFRIVDDLVKAQVDRLIGDPRYKNISTEFALPTSIVDGGILFIGLNPSEDRSGKTTGLFRYSLKQRKNGHRYFNKFEAVSQAVNLHWDHIDTLMVRRTKQEGIHEIMRLPHGIDFVWDQLQIFKILFESLNPKIIVVSNTLAAVFLGKNKEKEAGLGYDFIWDEKIGTYTHKGIPTFFSGMLSGQRALDLGSLERLNWHIRQALKQS